MADVNAIRHEFCTNGRCVVTDEKGQAGLCPVDRPADDPSLAAIRITLLDKAAARERLRAAVQHSRSIGRTWGEIGAVVGCSKQAARERFGP